MTIGGSRWLADVGFGSGLLEPVPLPSKVGVTQGLWSYRVISDNGIWLLPERTAQTAWRTQFSVAEERNHFAEIVMSNHYTSTWSQSPFLRRPVVVRKGKTQVRRLLGRHVSTTHPGHAVDEREIGDGEVASVLHDLGIALNAVDVASLTAALPAPDSRVTRDSF